MSLGGGSRGGGGTTQVVQESDPWEGQQPFLRDVMRLAQQAYQGTSQQPFEGQLVAGPTQMQQQSLDTAQGVANQAVGAGNNPQDISRLYSDRVQSGFYLEPALANNDAVAAAIGAQARPIMEQLTQEVLPQIESAAISQGAYGGARQANLQREALHSLGDEVARLSAEDYVARRELLPTLALTESQIASQVPVLAQQGHQLNLLPADIYGQIGAQQQMWEQDQLDQNYQRWTQAQQAPWQGLPEYASIVSGVPSFGSSIQTTRGGPSTLNNVLSGAIGGGAMGGAAGMGFGGLTAGAGMGAFAPWMLGGAALGGLLGIL